MAKKEEKKEQKLYGAAAAAKAGVLYGAARRSAEEKAAKMAAASSPGSKTAKKTASKPVEKKTADAAKKETKSAKKTTAPAAKAEYVTADGRKLYGAAAAARISAEQKAAENKQAKKSEKTAKSTGSDNTAKGGKTAKGSTAAGKQDVTVRRTANGKLEVVTADGRKLYGAAAAAHTGILTGAAKKSADERAAREGKGNKETKKNVVVTADGRTLYGAAAAAYNGVLTGAARKSSEERAAREAQGVKAGKKTKPAEKTAEKQTGKKAKSSAKEDKPLVVVTADGKKLYGAAAAAHTGMLTGAAKKSAEARAARIASGDEKKSATSPAKAKSAKKAAQEEVDNTDKQSLSWDDDEFLTNLYSDDGSREVDEAQLQRFIKKMHDLQITARKKKNVLEYNEIKDYLADVCQDEDLFERVLDRMESEGIDVLRTDEDPDDLPDDDELIIEEEEEVDVENIDLSVPDSVAIEDPVRMYLKEIGKVPLLSAEEEIALAKLMEAGIAAEKKLKDDRTKMTPEGRKNVQERIRGYEKELAALDKSDDDEVVIEEERKRLTDLIENSKKLLEQDKLKKKLTDKEKAALQAPVAAGEDAKNRLAEANLRLVVSIAKRYVGRGMLFLDLIQEGNLGLIKAVEKFDFRKGFKFSTYATWWIRQAITRAIADQARTIRIPVHMVETINKLIRVSRQLLQELGREPTPDEIAEKMNMPVERVREILKISQEPVSLETPIGEEEDSHLGDFIQDDHVPVPADAAAYTLLREQLVEVLGTLTEREQKVLRLRFGLDDGRTRTLEEVGRVFKVTRERIRQIEAKALRKLRHPSRSRKLKDYLD